ncbi:hypothetical protein [Primorskyibacter marinus]|uniref:hypothetical protein n=1 Tax=Primorskyibacter marinus TaxID=1977320 RepID=UPI000E309345|nr:hypothetical protein [Primorskyibacter marinus]
MMTHLDDTGIWAPARTPRAPHCNAIDIGLASPGAASCAVQTEDCATLDETRSMRRKPAWTQRRSFSTNARAVHLRGRYADVSGRQIDANAGVA